MAIHGKTKALTATMAPLQARAGFLVRRLHQIHLALFQEECGGFALTPVQYGLLSTVMEYPGIDQKSLAFEIGADRATASDVIKRLESRSLIRRRASSVDRRTKQVFLTEDGCDVVHKMYRNMLSAQRRLVEPLGKENAQKLVELMSQLVTLSNGMARAQMRDLPVHVVIPETLNPDQSPLSGK